jgi:hypothetical protein
VAKKEMEKAPKTKSMPSPIFICGIAPRSGTNYLRGLLSLHPDCGLFPIYEDFFIRMSGHLQRYAEITAEACSAQKNYQAQLMKSIGDGLVRLIQAQDPDKQIVLKTPTPVGIEHFESLFPGARLLLIVRDARDVIHSAMKSFDRPLADALQSWTTGADAILNFLNGPASKRHVLLIHYETLFQNPEEELRRILAFVEERWNGTATARDFAPIGRWHDWPTDRLDSVNRAVASMMRELGYTLSEKGTTISCVNAPVLVRTRERSGTSKNSETRQGPLPRSFKNKDALERRSRSAK